MHSRISTVSFCHYIGRGCNQSIMNKSRNFRNRGKTPRGCTRRTGTRHTRPCCRCENATIVTLISIFIIMTRTRMIIIACPCICGRTAVFTVYQIIDCTIIIGIWRICIPSKDASFVQVLDVEGAYLYFSGLVLPGL